MYSDTVTLFNRRHDRNGDTWFPTVLKNINVNMDKGAIIAQYGEQAQDNALLNVRLPSEKLYYPPKEWVALEDPANGITFASGQQFDFFWLGEWPDDAPISDDDYTEGFYDYMNKRYDHVFAVSSVNGPFTVIPHLEVTGK